MIEPALHRRVPGQVGEIAKPERLQQIADGPQDAIAGEPEGGAASVTPWTRRRAHVREFIATENASALVLLAATLGALAWANSPWDGGYRALWETRLGVTDIFGEDVGPPLGGGRARRAGRAAATCSTVTPGQNAIRPTISRAAGLGSG